MAGKNVAVVAHKFLTQPDDDLVSYLNSKKNPNVIHIMHSFDDAPDRTSYFRWYKGGKLEKEERTKDYSGYPEVLIYLKEMFFTIKWIAKSKVKWDVYVGMDGLCTLFGLKLRLTDAVVKVVYWAIDFVPENRFESILKSTIYHLVNTFGYRKADEMWDLSPRMVEARESFLGLKPFVYKKHKVVPYGVWTKRIRRYAYEDCERTTAVFMGHLMEKQGVQLVIEGIPDILKEIPDFRFKIIGTGRYMSELEGMVGSLGVEGNCHFTGRIDDYARLEDEVAKSCVAVAPYIKRLDRWTYYADPGKIKTYLSSGVPVVMTDLPWNAGEIEDFGCGLIVSDDAESVSEGIIRLMDPDINQDFRDKAVEYSERFDYNKIFGDLSL